MSPDTLSLAGKTAIVTGSGRETGIGAAIARALARNGASVAIHHVSEGSKPRAIQVAKDIENEFGVQAVVIQGAVEKNGVAKEMVEKVLQTFGVNKIDILGLCPPKRNELSRCPENELTIMTVNNAAAAQNTPLLDVQQDQLEYEFAVNVFGGIYMTQAVVDAGKMPQGGRIINIGTIASKVLITTPIYSATKAASDALTTMWAAEVSCRNHAFIIG